MRRELNRTLLKVYLGGSGSGPRVPDQPNCASKQRFPSSINTIGTYATDAVAYLSERHAHYEILHPWG